MDMISNVGGILGLFTGLSVLSLVEVGYWYDIRSIFSTKSMSNQLRSSIKSIYRIFSSCFESGDVDEDLALVAGANRRRKSTKVAGMTMVGGGGKDEGDMVTRVSSRAADHTAAAHDITLELPG